MGDEGNKDGWRRWTYLDEVGEVGRVGDDVDGMLFVGHCVVNS